LNILEWSPKTKALLWFSQCLVILVMLVLSYLVNPIVVNSDISRLFKSQGHSDINTVNNQIAQQAVKSQILLVGNTDKSHAIADSKLLAAQLLSLNEIAHVKSTYDNLPTINRIVLQYLPYRQWLLSDKYKRLLESKQPDKLFEHQFTLLNQMVDPNVSLTLEADLTLSLADYLSRSYLPTNTLVLENGFLIAQHNNKYYVLVVFESNASGLDINESQKVVTAIKQLLPTHQSEVLYTGSIFYASEASSTGQFEMSLFGTVSILIMLLLVWWGYRHVSSLLATLSIIVISVLYGMCALVIAFDEISIVALIFSITLIGISADYSFHSLSEIFFTRCMPKNPLKEVHRSLSMGFLTTAAGYLVLLFSPFILFQQIALFTIVGLAGAYLTAVLLFPWLIANKVVNTPPLPPFIIWLNNQHRKLTNYESTHYIVLITVIVVAIAFGLFKGFNDDVRSFYNVTSNIQVNERKVKDILGQKDEPQYILITGTTAQVVLEREEELTMMLDQHVKYNNLAHYKGITQWLPSIKKQKFNAQLMVNAQANGMFDKTKMLLGQATPILRPDIKSSQYLTLPVWLESPLGRLFKNQIMNVNNKYYSIVRLSGLNNVTAIKASLIDFEESYMVNKVDDISQQITQFRELLANVLLIALVAAWVVFALRFGLKIASIAILIPTVSIVLSLAVSVFIQGELDIFNMVASILILALGLDYSVYYAEHGFEKTITITTLMSALSSIAVFAILLLSSMPSIQSFGLTVFIGVIFVFILAPQVTKWQKAHA